MSAMSLLMAPSTLTQSPVIITTEQLQSFFMDITLVHGMPW